MKVVLDSRLLFHDLQPLFDHIVEAPVDSVYNNIVFEPTQKVLVAYSGNGRTLCRVIVRPKATVISLPDNCVEFTIPVHLLRHLIDPHIDGTLTIDYDETQTHIGITSSIVKGSWFYEIEPTDRFVKVPPLSEATPKVSFTAEQMNYIASTLLPMVEPVNFYDYSQNGIRFETFNNTLNLVARSGDKENAIISFPADCGLLSDKEVPAYLFKAVQKNINSNSGTISFYFTSDSVFIKTNSFIACSTLNHNAVTNKVELKHSSYFDSFEESDTPCLEIQNKAEFIKALESCLAFNDKDLLNLEVFNQSFYISTRYREGNYCEIKVAATFTGNQRISKCIDGLTLLKAVLHCSGEKVKIYFNVGSWATSCFLQGGDPSLKVYLNLFPKVKPGYKKQSIMNEN